MLPIVYEPVLPDSAATLNLSADNCHYLARVLRLAEGAEFELADGRGRRARARWQDGSAQMLEPTGEPRPGAPLTLLLPLLAAGKMSDTLRAAAACGVARVIVWTPERGKIPAGAGNPGRWRAVTVDAGRVAHSPWLPELLGPLPLAEALTRTAGATLLLLERSGARDWRPAQPAPEAGHALVIGPESGFSEAEIAACRAAGAVALSLGPATLRVEQAVLAALAVLRYLAG